MAKKFYHVLVIDDEEDILNFLKTLLESEGYKVTIAQSGKEALEKLKEEIPHLIILDVVMPEMSGYEVCQAIRKNPALKHIPIIMLSVKDSIVDEIKGWRLGINEYKVKPFNPEELVAIIESLIYRVNLDIDANPITKLPGNNSIRQEINRCIEDKSPFAVCFIDLDNFKAFNDHYGFDKGDEVIKFTSDVIINAVHQIGNEEDFIGHIGGDDFVVITTPDKIDLLCQKIIKDFDEAIPKLYSKEDVARGYIIGYSRRGEREEFPIMTISIGVVTNKKKKLTHLVEVSVLGTELKEYAKTFLGSNYVVDKRRKEEKVIKRVGHLLKKERILIIDDDYGFSLILSSLLKKEGYLITAVQNRDSALAQIKKKWFNVVLLDIKLLDRTILEVLKKIKEKTPDTIVIIITASSTTELPIELLSHNIDDYLQREPDLEKIGAAIKKSIAKQRLELRNKNLTKSLIKKNMVLNKKINEMVRLIKSSQALYIKVMGTLVEILEAKDFYLKGHSDRVTNYALSIAKGLKLSKDNQKLICYASQLHDIGKVGIKDFILHKVEKLSDEEWNEIKLHSTISADILKPLEFLGNAATIIKYHHERYDGSGYPEGLRGDDIPLEARIIAVADAFDAILSDRPYRKAKSVENAIEELKRYSSSQFDPRIVKVFLKVLGKGQIDLCRR